MAIVGAKQIRIRVSGKGEPEPILVFRRPTNEELAEYEADKYSIDFTTKELKSNTISRIRLADKILVGCENFEYIDDESGEVKPLTTSVPGWIDMIDAQLKAHAVMAAFENVGAELDYSKK